MQLAFFFLDFPHADDVSIYLLLLLDKDLHGEATVKFESMNLLAFYPDIPGMDHKALLLIASKKIGRRKENPRASTVKRHLFAGAGIHLDPVAEP